MQVGTNKVRVETNKTDDLENRVLVFMPTGRDGSLVCAALAKAEVQAQICATPAELEESVSLGAGTILLAEEALENGTLEQLIEIFDQQPVWSDIPVILFASNGHNAERLLSLVGPRLNATIVERPIRITMLISAVRGALRARQRQFQTRDLLDQLKQSDHQKDLFLATLSHELRTPLNSILGWIQLLRSNSGTINTAKGLEVIERNAKAQSEIISDILFVSRIITGKLTLDIKPIKLIPVIEESIEVVLPSIQAKNIHLNVFFDHKIEKIKGDRERLKQVFWNILSNAVKFTPPDGRIDLSAFTNGTQIEIEICDSGVGIESEFLPFIFERFRQADSSYTRKVGGLGLGLAIVRHLVELHGGSVSVTSDGPGCGSAFTVKLPILSTAPQESANHKASDETAERVKADELPPETHILLVEDNDDSREMLIVLFDQFNLQLTAVASVAEAMKVLEQTRPDILISDIGMPDEDGYDLIRRVRRLPPEKGGNVPAIALTGYAGDQDRDLALQTGYQAHLSKPLDIDELIRLVKNILDGK